MGYFNSYCFHEMYAFMKSYLNLSRDSFTGENKESIISNWRVFVSVPGKAYLNPIDF